ncbi:universal stress protein [Couchioplanes caeruleus]|uniref:universal stress protein n=1 Tax=Couchioplanes caeruleus TaxID=56438 RepID=UPI0020BE1BFB|nr:universal stress protein [Couchioplanes caeruleus]UQU61895.1 universal stress protein [Couchioplanes caeruleus]
MTDLPIVVGVSGSAASRNAVGAAAWEAAMHGCPLHLVHCFNWVPTLTGPAAGEPRPAPRDLMRCSVAEATRLVPASAITPHFLEGSAVTALLRKARTAAMLVIGDGGLRSGVCLAREAPAVQLAARAPCTVVVTRPAPPPAGPVLAGVNGPAGSGQALDFAFDAAASRGADLVVVHAWTPPDGDDAGPAAQEADLRKAVDARAHRYGVRVRVRMVRGDPSTVLRAESRDAGLVVVGARGQQPYRGLLGSVTQTLLHHAPSPVAVVRNLLPGSCPDEAAGRGTLPVSSSASHR